jgi:predicted ATPase
MLKTLTLLRDRIADPSVYPFCVPAIAALTRLDFPARVTFFAGENGTGKSTLLEAIAAHIGFGREGGNRDLRFETSESSRAVEPLVRALRLGFQPARTGEGFYFRAESLFSLATQIDEWDSDPGIGGRIVDSYGGVSLHQHSHGETFFTVLDHKFRRSGLFLLDEPEAALSPQRQLSFLILIHQTLRDYKDAQFIISTHSPILLGYPGARIVSFDDGALHEIPYEETAPMQIVRRFTTDRDRFLEELFREPDPDPLPLFDDEPSS